MAKVTMEHPEALKALRQLFSDTASIMPNTYPEATVEDLYDWCKLAGRKFVDRLQELGYLVDSDAAFDLATLTSGSSFQIWSSAVEGVKNEQIEIGTFLNSCTREVRPQIVEDVVLAHQKQFSEPEVGFVPSAKLSEGREAEDRRNEAHSQLHIHGYYREIHRDHTPIDEKFEQEVIECGYSSLREFLRISRILPSSGRLP